MPKIIEDIKERILESAKCVLLEGNYSGFTIRSVAKKCGIAVGTVYNYYPSKDILAASVMLEDWHKSIHDMRQGCESALTIIEGLRCVYNGITKFTSIYDKIWSDYSIRGRTEYLFSEQHKMLRSQLVEIIHPLLARFNADEDEFLEIFIAENLLLASANQFDFKSLEKILSRILIKHKEGLYEQF